MVYSKQRDLKALKSQIEFENFLLKNEVKFTRVDSPDCPDWGIDYILFGGKQALIIDHKSYGPVIGDKWLNFSKFYKGLYPGCRTDYYVFLFLGEWSFISPDHVRESCYGDYMYAHLKGIIKIEKIKELLNGN